MSHAEYEAELQALREQLPEAAQQDNGTVPSKTAAQFYSIDIANRILDQYILGKSLSSICRQAEMPSYGTVMLWAKDHPEFSKLIAIARKVRAIGYEDKAIEEAELLDDPRMVGVAKLKIDTFWKAAEVGNPDVYGKKVSHSGSIDQTGKVVIQVITGFGPLNENLQFPKLNADGTIEKAPPKEIESEIIHATDEQRDKPGNSEGSASPDSGAEERKEECPTEIAGHEDAARSSGDSRPDGV